MRKFDPAVSMNEMLEYGKKILYLLEGFTEDTFIDDERTVLAVIKCFEVIGEAATRIPKEIRDNYPGVEWKRIIAYRNFLIHAYHAVLEEIVFRIAGTSLPSMISSLEKILDEPNKPNNEN